MIIYHNKLPKKNISLTQIIQVFPLIFQVVQLFAIIVGFWFTLKQLDSLKKGIIKDETAIIYEHKQRINELLRNDKEFAKSMPNIKHNDIFEYILLNDYEKLFRLRCENMITDRTWNYVEDMIYSQLQPPSPTTSLTFHRKFWEEKTGSVENSPFDPNFVRYVNHLTEKSKSPTYNKDKIYCQEQD